MDRTFDRLVKFDAKSKAYPIRELITAGLPLRSYTWRCNTWLDQGSEGACTGFAVTQEAAARPCVVPNLTNKIARQVYNRAKQLDEWPGEDYEGSSVLGAIKAGTERCWYREYRWAFGEEDLAMAIGYKGPAVLGINWYEGMMEPDGNGFIYPTGQVLGGHAILCNGFNKKLGRYTLHNSWGEGWGRYGECFITRIDMNRLLREQGEACIPVIRAK